MRFSDVVIVLWVAFMVLAAFHATGEQLMVVLIAIPVGVGTLLLPYAIAWVFEFLTKRRD